MPCFVDFCSHSQPHTRAIPFFSFSFLKRLAVSPSLFFQDQGGKRRKFPKNRSLILSFCVWSTSGSTHPGKRSQICHFVLLICIIYLWIWYFIRTVINLCRILMAKNKIKTMDSFHKKKITLDEALV